MPGGATADTAAGHPKPARGAIPMVGPGCRPPRAHPADKSSTSDIELGHMARSCAQRFKAPSPHSAAHQQSLARSMPTASARHDP